MNTKKYTSMKEIDDDLKILKLRKEIETQKFIQRTSLTKDSLNLGSIIPNIASEAVNIFTPGIKGIALGFIIKKLLKLK